MLRFVFGSVGLLQAKLFAGNAIATRIAIMEKSPQRININ
jgi:hypothetical protein